MSLRRWAPLLFPAKSQHTATVIFLHGLGDTGNGWASAVENWRRRAKLDHVKFILPHAPVIPITCNRGMRMPGWYDITSLDGTVAALRANEDEAGMLVSRTYLHELIEQEVAAGIAPERIVLSGFSQGGAIALLSGLTYPKKLAALAVLSAYLPLSIKFRDLVAECARSAGSDKMRGPNQNTPIFMAHGDVDMVVPVELGKMSFQMLKEWGWSPELKIYSGLGHSAVPEELDAVMGFLEAKLPVAAAVAAGAPSAIAGDSSSRDKSEL